MTKDGLERMPEHVHTTPKQTPPEGQSLKHVARSIRSGRFDRNQQSLQLLVAPDENGTTSSRMR